MDSVTPATYTSNFSAGVDSWLASGGSIAGNIDSIGGQNDNLRFTASTSTGYKIARTAAGSLVTSASYRLTADVYIPSSNTEIDGAGFIISGDADFDSGQAGSFTSLKDQWVSISVLTGPSSASARISVCGMDSGGSGASFTAASNGDIFYVRNVVATKLDLYQSNFSAGIDGWADSNATLSAVDGIGGEDDVLKVECDITNVVLRAYKDVGQTAGKFYLVEADMYLPSGNTTVNKVGITTDADAFESDVGSYTTETDQWVTVRAYKVASDTYQRFGYKGGSSATIGDTYYIKNVTVTEVTKLPYDAVQTTTTKQPKIVDAGEYMRDDNSNIIADFDGVDDTLVTSYDAGSLTALSLFVAHSREDADKNENIVSAGSEATGASYGGWSFGYYDRFSCTNLAVGVENVNPCTLSDGSVELGFAVLGDTYMYGGYNGARKAVAAAYPPVAFNATVGALRIGCRYTFAEQNFGKFKLNAVVLYDADKTADRVGIERTLATKFGITGLPASYDVLKSGGYATAAYSPYSLSGVVGRGLVSETEGAYFNPTVRVRRDSDDSEKSFGSADRNDIEAWVNEDVTWFDVDTSGGTESPLLTKSNCSI